MLSQPCLHTSGPPSSPRSSHPRVETCCLWLLVLLQRANPFKTVFKALSLPDTHSLTITHNLPAASQAGRSQLFHSCWIFPHSRCLAISLVPILCQLALIHSFIHPSSNECCSRACAGAGPGPGPRVEREPSQTEHLPSRSTSSAGERHRTNKSTNAPLEER